MAFAIGGASQATSWPALAEFGIEPAVFALEEAFQSLNETQSIVLRNSNPEDGVDTLKCLRMLKDGWGKVELCVEANFDVGDMLAYLASQGVITSEPRISERRDYCLISDLASIQGFWKWACQNNLIPDEATALIDPLVATGIWGDPVSDLARVTFTLGDKTRAWVTPRAPQTTLEDCPGKLTLRGIVDEPFSGLHIQKFQIRAYEQTVVLWLESSGEDARELHDYLVEKGYIAAVEDPAKEHLLQQGLDYFMVRDLDSMRDVWAFVKANNTIPPAIIPVIDAILVDGDWQGIWKQGYSEPVRV